MVLGLADFGSAVFFVVAYDNIVDSSLSAVKVFSLKGEKCCVGCGCYNASDHYNSTLADVLSVGTVGLLYCLGKNSTVSHTHVSDVFFYSNHSSL